MIVAVARRPLAAFFIAVVVVATVIGSSKAADICNMTEDGLKACKPSVTPSNPVDPSPECCTAVAGADMKCLCSYKHSSLLPALGIDPGLALALPAKCNLPALPC